MDIARPDLARKKRLRHSLCSVSAIVVIALVTVGVSRLEPAAPRVDRDTIYLDTVQRGPMVRQVRGTGTLFPEQIRWIPATTDGTVERIVIRPGALVAPDTVILELSNPELEQSALEARLNLEAAEARYSNRQVEVERELLNQRATRATTEAQLRTARLQADADGQLFTQGLVASLQLQQSQSAEQEYETRYALERERLQMATDTVEAQLRSSRPRWTVCGRCSSCGGSRWTTCACGPGCRASCSRCRSKKVSASRPARTSRGSVTLRC